MKKIWNHITLFFNWIFGIKKPIETIKIVLEIPEYQISIFDIRLCEIINLERDRKSVV